MKIDWQQLSLRERDTALRHYIMHNKVDSAVTAQKVCEEMSRTHFLLCDKTKGGSPVYRFVTGKGETTGEAVSDDAAEGIYKAALRAHGINVRDKRELGSSPMHRRAVDRQGARARAH